MTIRWLWPRSRDRRSALSPAMPWWLALAGAAASAQAATQVLRPRRGLIAPDPARLSDYFDDAEVARARAFARPQLALGLGAGAIQTAALAALAVRPPARLYAGGIARRRPLAAAALTGAALTAGVGMSSLPVRAVARRRSLAAGLATQSWGGWAADVAKGTAITSALSGLGAPAAIVLMRHRPASWWIPAAATSVAGAALLTFAAPLVLDPIFNRFTPLPSGQTREDVLELAEAAGVRVGEVYEVDASRRTTAANAYVAGLGATKRVVLFDTLLKSFTREETRLVVAHELAHVRHRDVPHGLLLTALMAPGAMYATAALTSAISPSGEIALASPAVLPPLGLAAAIVGAVVGVASARYSRQVEARADAFALRLTAAPDPFVSFERRIVMQNLADPQPPRWLTRLLASHPPTLERIGIALAYRRGASEGASAASA